MLFQTVDWTPTDPTECVVLGQIANSFNRCEPPQNLGRLTLVFQGFQGGGSARFKSKTPYTLSDGYAAGQIKSCSVKNIACHQVRRNQTLSCGVRLGGRGCPTVANKTLYTLAVRHENSIYIEPSLGHSGCSTGAQKSRTVKRNDTGLQSASQSVIKNITF